LVALVGAAPPSAPQLPPAEWMLEQVKALAGPAMEGRGSGTRGADLAAAHVAAVFKVAGLTPAGEAGTDLQSFLVPAAPAPAPAHPLAPRAPPARELTPGADF